MESIHSNIRHFLAANKKGDIVVPADFRGHGSQDAIKMALSRMAKEGEIRRLAHGIYYIPYVDPVLGELTPSAEAVAEQLAEKERVRIRPTGVFALNKLGLSTQVPTRLVYFTDGHPRKLTIGKSTIQFKPTTPKKMALRGKVSAPLILGLEELDLDQLTKKQEERILYLLQMEEPGDLDHDMKLAPGHIYDYLIKYTKRIDEHRMVVSD